MSGIAASLYIYDLQHYATKMQVRMWIDKAKGLPFQSQIITVSPKNFEERYITYSFAPEIQAPI